MEYLVIRAEDPQYLDAVRELLKQFGGKVKVEEPAEGSDARESLGDSEGGRGWSVELLGRFRADRKEEMEQQIASIRASFAAFDAHKAKYGSPIPAHVDINNLIDDMYDDEFRQGGKFEFLNPKPNDDVS